MNRARWIWYQGDYEIYHSIKLHSRREEFGAEYPSMWGLSNVYPRVKFYRDCRFEQDDVLTVTANGKAYVLVDNRRYPQKKPITIKAGRHRIEVLTIRESGGFPAIYVQSREVVSDKTWFASPGAAKDFIPVGAEPGYFSPEDNVDVFPFVYTDIKPVKSEEHDTRIVYDFGRELFAKLCFDIDKDDFVIYGETFEEATDPDDALVHESVGAGSHCLVPRAFRYVSFAHEVTNLSAKLELLQEKTLAQFSCDDPEVEKILSICAYTFHLNCREFLLDGIKRDRWCWAGDAYQSFMVNDYLFADRALNRRTITALYGKPPYYEHINCINDYSALLIIGTYDYYFTTGDEAFIRFIYPRTKELYLFITSRLDENGLVTERDGDWIFIDWSDIDKSGPLCAEQILLWQVYQVMAKLSAVVGEAGEAYLQAAEKLEKVIYEKFWDAEKVAFIDSFTSGRRNVTRHASIFAILFDFVNTEKAETLLHSVLGNDNITRITTPYFKLYELMALAKLGKIKAAEDLIDSYWGGMVKLGATTIWEEYDPNKQGIEHYGMYGMKYGKSLCHAWGSGPIFLLGRYCLGVYPTSVGSKTFTVKPNPGKYKSFKGSVPLGGGLVTVEYINDKLSVEATVEGGTLVWKEKEYPLVQEGEKWVARV